MAMIAVQLVLEKMAALITDEARLLGGVCEGIEELQNDLSSMKAFLQDAETRSESDQGVNDWVKQVRDVAYDAEDVLEEFILCLKPPYGHGFKHSTLNFCHSIRKLRARHSLAAQIQSIKVRVKNISDRRSAFSFNRVEDIARSSNAGAGKWHDQRLASLYIDEADLVGIEEPRSLLVSWLVEGEEKLTSISVVGMGGLGKTTLVKKVYDSQPVRRSFDCQSWVNVSKLFTPPELLRDALKGFLQATKEPAPEGMELMTDIQLIDSLRKYLQQKRYVIVFDDIWSVDAWEAIKYAFPDCNCGSRIMFTTRLSSLTASIENSSHVHRLQPLPEKEAWTLFCKKAFRGEHNGVCPQNLEQISQRILKKCEGLPLAIAAIGGLLSKKNKEVLEWTKVHDSLAAELKSENNLGTLGRILRLSYDHLPYYLKPCYLYLSVFPEDYVIKTTKLIRLWIAERFVEEKRGLTMEEVAEDYLNQLVSRSMIQVVEIDFLNRIRYCRIHDLVREILQLKSREESFVATTNHGNISIKDKVRRLSLHGNCEGLALDVRLPYVRSLLLFLPIDYSTSPGSAFFRGFKFLRVLQLDRAPLVNLPPKFVELIHLRYLSLRMTGIKELPEYIGRLKNLEFLDLKRSFISWLPMGILQLKSLCQIRGYHHRFNTSRFFPDCYGIRVPSGIERLTCLEKLGIVEVDDNKLVRDLGQLTKLRRLGILKLKEEHGRDLCYTLDRLNHLTGLYMLSMDRSEFLHLDSLLTPPKYLQRLFLKCRLSSLPGWITSLQHLSKLVLQYSSLNGDPLKTLQRLPSLVELELREAYDGNELCSDAGGFPRLKKLGFYFLKRLNCIRLAEGAMPGLRSLEIAACRELEMVPFGIEHLRNIEKLQLLDLPTNFLKTIRRSSGKDFWRVQHIPIITNIYEREEQWFTETLS